LTESTTQTNHGWLLQQVDPQTPPIKGSGPRFSKAKEKDKNIVKILKYDWEPDHAPERINSFVDSEGQLWQVWIVPEGFLGQVS